MEVTHGIALSFAILFALIATVFSTMIWWILVFAYSTVLALMAIMNSWEVLFFPVLFVLGIVSVIGVVITGTKGDLI